jgi:nickel-dependent lactate racemase
MNQARVGHTPKIIKVPQLAWHGPRDLDLPMPEGWEVEICNMAGYNRPAMDPKQIETAVANPIGMPPLKEFARDKKEVAIIFDDLCRVTRVAEIVPFILKELGEAGVPDSRIRFIAALGNHGAMDRFALAKKLGEATLARFPVYNHNAHDLCTHVGTTSRGTKVFVNSEVMHCDLKIAISSVTPHMSVAFSGGGKMILPGVASIQTVETNHTLPTGDYETNSRRLDMEETAKLAGLNMVIECIVNLWGDTVALFAGAETEAHEAAVQEARRHYLCPKAVNKDIVVANAYAKVMESAGSIKTATSLAQKGGSFVLISNSPEGQVVHFLGGVWGRTKTDAGRKELRIPIPPNVQRAIVFTEYSDLAGLGFFKSLEKVEQMTRWNDVIQTLQRLHGDHAKVVVYPSADIVYFG